MCSINLHHDDSKRCNISVHDDGINIEALTHDTDYIKMCSINDNHSKNV